MDEDTRFRRALKSPFVMVGLCLMAGMAVYHNVIQSTSDFSLPNYVASTPSPTEQTPTTPIPSLVGHDKEGTQWIANPTRDPFAPISLAKWSKSSSQESWTSSSLSLKPHGATQSQLTLKAIAIEAQHRSAVINRQVVVEGEIVEGYEVVSIQLKGVLLTRYGKKKFLTFDTDSTS